MGQRAKTGLRGTSVRIRRPREVSMRSRRLAFLFYCLLPACALLVLPACDDEDTPRSRLSITRIAGSNDSQVLGAAPLQSDVRDAGPDQELFTSDDSVVEDELLITIENDPTSLLMPADPTGAFGSVVVTGYEVVFHADGEHIDTLTGALHLVVPSGSQAIASIVVVTADAKRQPPLITLAQVGGELVGSATITVWGYETTSEDRISTTATVQIHFADWS